MKKLSALIDLCQGRPMENIQHAFVDKSDTVHLSRRAPTRTDVVRSVASFAASYIGLVQAFSNTLTQHLKPKRTAPLFTTCHFLPPVCERGGHGATAEVNYPKENDVARGSATLTVITRQVGSC